MSKATPVRVLAGGRRAVVLALLVGGSASPQAASPAPEYGPSAPVSRAGPEAEVAQVTAAVVLDGQTLFRVRGARAYPAAERARAISERIESVARTPLIPAESVEAVPAEDVVNLTAGDAFLMAVTDVDARHEGVDRPALARVYGEQIARALRSYREARSPAVVLRGAKSAAVATAAFVALLLALGWVARRVEARLGRSCEERIRSLQFRSFEIVRAQRIRDWLRWLLSAGRGATVAVLGYLWLEVVLGSFPATRPLAGHLLDLVLDPLGRLGGALAAQVPNLAFLLVIYLLARWLLRLARLFFEAVERGQVTLSGFESEWALPTLRLVRLAVIVFALVVAYPYVPGSSTAAFQGLSILLGVMLSIGSSSFIANVIAGYSMIYRRAFRVGDRIRVGEVLGDVSEIRLQVTHVRSPKNEEIVVPNSTLLQSHVTNYSTLARSRGLILHTSVGIGYETPWRQVEAMLLLAAEGAPGLARDPAPFVVPTRLGDFCVTYELNVYCDAPAEMNLRYGHLHRSILDVFNEYGVQIMTPAYESDPDTPKLVPKEQWWAAPASPTPPLPPPGAGGEAR